MTDAQLIHGRLEEVAMKITDNFCYACYKVVTGDRCPTCGTDDFMRHLKGVGVEYGTEWVIEHMLENNLTAVDGDELFEELLDECYPEVKIGCCTFSPSQVMKELDPTCFEIGAKENLDSLAEDGNLYEYGGNYYRIDELEDMLDELEAK